MSKSVVIVGNGIAGITAARHIRKLSDHRIVVVSAESAHFFARTALMYIYMGHMRYEDTKPYEDWFWEKNRIELVQDTAERVDVAEKALLLASGTSLRYDALILATGSKSNMPQWPGVDLDGVQGLYGLPDLQKMENATAEISRATVIGGGLIGIELVEMLRSRKIEVSFVVREDTYMNYLLPNEESGMVGEEIREHGVDLHLGTEVASIVGDSGGRVKSVITSTGNDLASEFVGVAVGVHPNVGLASASGITTGRGIKVNRFFETEVDSIYAIGDCAEFSEPGIGHRSVEQLWYSGRAHGKTVARTICGDRTPYDSGVFYNSAKFFNLEYQTYGFVPTASTETVESIVWKHPRSRKLIRISYERDKRRVLGFNVLGIRFRHEQCVRWIRQGATVDQVVQSLSQANFDPEFAVRHEADLASSLRD